MLYYDTETCGFHGPTILIQYAIDGGEITLHEVWRTEIQETLILIEWMMEQENVGFNLAFDHFHLCQTYTTLTLLGRKVGYDELPEDHIDNYAICEKEARLGPCIKPKTALDLMLHARKGPYQSTMDRSDIRLKRIPTPMAHYLARELEQRIPFKDVYFARYKTKQDRWQVHDIHDDVGDINPDFKDIVLKFAPSSALKALAADALGVDTETIKLFSSVDTPKSSKPVEKGYAPYALAVGEPGNWKEAWPDIGKIKTHIAHWAFNDRAREYARDDVVYTRGLHYYFSFVQSGSTHEEARDLVKVDAVPLKFLQCGDDDSILACQVASCRWRGYPIDRDKLKERLHHARLIAAKAKYNFNSVEVCRRYLNQVLDETEKMVMQVNGKTTTKGIILEEIAKWMKSDVCNDCGGFGCNKCDEGLCSTGERHPAAIRASEILESRRIKKEIELYLKLLEAGDRIHFSFKVIGTLSNRMSGADGLNPQGIKSDNETRSCFILADKDLGFVLDGGDFDGFEVGLMDASYGDPVLHAELLTGKKIHALAGELFFGKTYDEILATKGLPNELDLYSRSKNGVFALFYGGEEYTLQTRVGISEERAKEAYSAWINKYEVWGQARKDIFNLFCSMRQPGGIGTRVEWHEPAQYIESMLGFKRYFELETRVCRTLFEMAESPPDSLTNIKMKVMRRDREQTGVGACRSALLAAAFQIQAACMRAAANHVIQCTGAQITKSLQRRLWGLQPSGVSHWRIQPLNIHDEVMAPMLESVSEDARIIVYNFIEEYKKIVPLLAMDWKHKLLSWAGK